MEWLHRKADENAHNEILAFLMIIMGMNMLIGGLLVTLIVTGEPSLLIIFPIGPPLNPSAALGLILTIAGFATVSAGFILILHYDRKRSWYVGQIEKSTIHKEKKDVLKSVDEILEEYTGKKR